MPEKENKKSQTKDVDKSVELLKIQVCSDRIHVRLSYLTTISWAIWIGFAVLFYTLYSQNVLPLVAIGLGVLTLTLGTIYQVFHYRRSYQKELVRISELIEKVKQGNELPRLEELMK
ncbi:MAG: hypothetical protein WED07_15840 [Candidatus Freyarchaeum deiterrae]